MNTYIKQKSGIETKIEQIFNKLKNIDSLSTSEESNLYQKLRNEGVSVQEIIKRIPRTAPHVFQRLKLNHTSKEILILLDNKKIAVSDVVKIIDICGNDFKKQQKMVNEIVNKKMNKICDMAKVKIVIQRELNKLNNGTTKDSKKIIDEIEKMIKIVKNKMI